MEKNVNQKMDQSTKVFVDNVKVIMNAWKLDTAAKCETLGRCAR